ncbi:MAG: creatininase family protein [Oscillospiraceae bacterium]|jgi:creatinine amidohydrolase|nr:creatininase family protein [Oscillospiraceae bacterium]
MMVEYQYLRPRQMVERRNAMPVAYIGLGVLEWHGLHNPLGLDGVKANGIACHLARKLGGVVMPPQFWGDYRRWIGELDFDASFKPGFSVPENHFDHTLPICELLGLDKEAFVKDAMRSRKHGKDALWIELMVHTMFQIETLGFKAIVMIPGHYPLIGSLGRAMERYTKEGGQCKVKSITDFVYNEGGLSGDHAAALETSLMLALYPELVDMSELDSDLAKPNIGVIGRDPRTHASKELGEKILARFVLAAAEFLKGNGLLTQ